MGAAVSITRLDLTASELRKAASGEKNSAAARRIHERSVGKVLAKLGYRKLSVRPRHPQADGEAQEMFKKTSPRQSRRKSPTAPKAGRSKSGSKMRPGSASRAR